MNIIFKGRNKSSLQKWLWTSLMIAGWITVVLMWVNIYSSNDKPLRIEKSHDGGKDWYEKLILPFYFTHISNLMGAAIGTALFFNIFKNTNFINSFKVITFVNLTITMIVYFTVLMPFYTPKEVMGWIINILAHLIVPLLMIFSFLLNTLKENDFKWKIKPWIQSFKFLLFPIFWIVIATIIYVSLGMKKSAAIYFFINFKYQAWYTSFAFITGIGILYYLFALLGNWLTLRKNI